MASRRRALYGRGWRIQIAFWSLVLSSAAQAASGWADSGTCHSVGYAELDGLVL